MLFASNCEYLGQTVFFRDDVGNLVAMEEEEEGDDCSDEDVDIDNKTTVIVKNNVLGFACCSLDRDHLQQQQQSSVLIGVVKDASVELIMYDAAKRHQLLWTSKYGGSAKVANLIKLKSIVLFAVGSISGLHVFGVDLENMSLVSQKSLTIDITQCICSLKMRRIDDDTVCIAAAALSGRVVIWKVTELQTRENRDWDIVCEREVTSTSRITSIQWIDDDRCVFGLWDGSVAVLSISSGSLSFILEEVATKSTPADVHFVVVSHCSNYLASIYGSSSNSLVRIVSFQIHSLIRSFHLPDGCRGGCSIPWGAFATISNDGHCSMQKIGWLLSDCVLCCNTHGLVRVLQPQQIECSWRDGTRKTLQLPCSEADIIKVQMQENYLLLLSEKCAFVSRWSCSDDWTAIGIKKGISDGCIWSLSCVTMLLVVVTPTNEIIAREIGESTMQIVSVEMPTVEAGSKLQIMTNDESTIRKKFQSWKWEYSESDRVINFQPTNVVLPRPWDQLLLQGVEDYRMIFIEKKKRKHKDNNTAIHNRTVVRWWSCNADSKCFQTIDAPRCECPF